MAGWSADAIRLYYHGKSLVFFENGFIESWKEALISSHEDSEAAGMQQLQRGMDQGPKAFIKLDRGSFSLAENITYRARVTHISDVLPTGDAPHKIEVVYETASGKKLRHTSNFLIFAIPYGASAPSQSLAPLRPPQSRLFAM